MAAPPAGKEAAGLMGRHLPPPPCRPTRCRTGGRAANEGALPALLEGSARIVERPECPVPSERPDFPASPSLANAPQCQLPACSQQLLVPWLQLPLRTPGDAAAAAPGRHGCTGHLETSLFRCNEKNQTAADHIHSGSVLSIPFKASS